MAFGPRPGAQLTWAPETRPVPFATSDVLIGVKAEETKNCPERNDSDPDIETIRRKEMNSGSHCNGSRFDHWIQTMKELVMRREEISMACLAVLVIFAMMFVVVADVVKAADSVAAEAKLVVRA